jgi:hypothetical protein
MKVEAKRSERIRQKKISDILVYKSRYKTDMVKNGDPTKREIKQTGYSEEDQHYE